MRDADKFNDRQLTEWDRTYVWHPFTHLRDWLDPGREMPIVVRGEGPHLIDARGRKLIDGNSSIWCNLHGHRHPKLEMAMQEQLARFAHSSFLGYSHPAGILLGKKLIEDHLGPWGYTRVFYSESGSNAVEAALRMAIQWQALAGRAERRQVLAFGRSYHGDSLGAVSVTGLDVFKKHTHHLGHDVIRLEAPEDLEHITDTGRVAALIFEPLVAGAAGIRLWPPGMLKRCRDWCDRNDVLLIYDEILTGFGRTGKMFALENEGVPSDILVLGKGLSGGVSPLSATIVNDRVFRPFAEAEEVADSFLYGHSYAGHAIGCATGIASLEIFEDDNVLGHVDGTREVLREVLAELQQHEAVVETRQCGLIACVEVLSHPGDATGRAYGSDTGKEVVRECLGLGLATRNIGNSIVLILPLCADAVIFRRCGTILARAIDKVFSGLPARRTDGSPESDPPHGPGG